MVCIAPSNVHSLITQSHVDRFVKHCCGLRLENYIYYSYYWKSIHIVWSLFWTFTKVVRAGNWPKPHCFTFALDWDIRVEQAHFSEMSVISTPEMGCVVDVHASRGNPARSFKPDFCLVRQHSADAGEDYKKIILGKMCALYWLRDMWNTRSHRYLSNYRS